MNRVSVTSQIILSLMLAMALVGIIIYPRTAAAVSLKETSVIRGDTIKLGDVFDGLPAGGERVLGPAPRPGEDMVLNARTLLRIALAMDLPWRPVTTAESVTLKRDAKVIEGPAIESALREALASQGLAGSYKIIYAGQSPRIVLPAGSDAPPQVTRINYQPGSDMFEATLSARNETTEIVGNIQRLAKVPVLREALKGGDIIGIGDIDYMDIPQSSLQADIVLKAEDLTGMTPRHLVTAGQPIKASQIQSPRLVSRGDTVTVVLNAGGLSLTAQGKALENGAKGERIRIVNTTSNKTIVAEVTDNKEVAVGTF